MGNFSRLLIRFFCCCIAGWGTDSCCVLSSIAEPKTVSVVMSKRLDLRRLRLWLLRRRKYFWAWLATWVGVRVLTKFLEIPLQSPFPTFCNPSKNSLCSSSVHGTPRFRSRFLAEGWTTSSEAYPALTSLLFMESWGCSNWARLFILALFLNDPSITLTPNSMNPLLQPSLTSEHVWQFWPSFPHCREHELAIFLSLTS